MISYLACNALSTVVRTFDAKEPGKTWVKANADRHNGLHLVEEVRTVQRRKVYAPRGGK